MRCAAFQLDVARGEVDDNLARVEHALRDASARGVELVVLPEMWPTSFLEAGFAAAQALASTEAAWTRVAGLSRELGIAVAGSAYGAGRADERLRNRLRLYVDGELALAYDKLHLFSPTAETEGFSAGVEAPRTVETRLGRIAGVICYDLRFPEAWRAPFLDRVELLVVPAQWPSPRAAQFRALVHGVAAANQCFVVAANRIGRETIGRRELALEFLGRSTIAGPDGSTLAEAGDGERLVIADLDLEQARELKRRVPALDDRRPEIYARWKLER